MLWTLGDKKQNETYTPLE